MTKEGDLIIAVLQRGHVVVGRVVEAGHEVVLRPAAVVRRWGTDRGIGQLAAEGPRPGTILDPCDEWRYHVLTDIGVIPCREEPWRGHL